MSLPFFFCMERESGVSALINSIGAHEAVDRGQEKDGAGLRPGLRARGVRAEGRRRLGAVAGLPQLGRPANSLQIFAYLPDFAALWTVLLVTLAARALAAFLAVRIIYGIARRSRGNVAAAALSLLLPAPGAAALVWAAL